MTKTVNPLAALISGKGAKARIEAANTIATQAYGAEHGKETFLNTLRNVLGDAPSDDLKAFARAECIAGIAAARMPVSEFGKGVRSVDMPSRIALCRDWIDNYQAPSTAVSGKVPALRKSKKGWRSAVVHRVIRNAEDRASKYLAELGASNAQTEADKNNAKRAKGGNPSPHHGKGGKPSPDSAPSHSELVQPAKPVDGVQYAATMLGFISTAMQYANKHAKVQPMEYNPVAEQLIALHKLALKADADMHVRLAAQDAERAAKADATVAQGIALLQERHNAAPKSKRVKK